jgi:hypothetical protein
MGTGSNTGTALFNLATDGSGNILEVPKGAGGGEEMPLWEILKLLQIQILLIVVSTFANTWGMKHYYLLIKVMHNKQ